MKTILIIALLALCVEAQAAPKKLLLLLIPEATFIAKQDKINTFLENNEKRTGGLSVEHFELWEKTATGERWRVAWWEPGKFTVFPNADKRAAIKAYLVDAGVICKMLENVSGPTWLRANGGKRVNE